MHTNLLFIAILLIGTCACQDLDDIIGSIFNTSAGLPSGTGEQFEPFVINPVPTELPFVTQRPVTQAPSSSDLSERIPLTPINDNSYQPCNAGKECVREYLCSSGRINNDGATIIDVRFDDHSCPFMETCCAIGDTVLDPIIKPVNPPTGCGYRNPEGIAIKIKGADSDAEFGEFPWMVAVMREEAALHKILNVYLCGGSLITPQMVLTAAHCVHSKRVSKFIVRAGEWETSTKTEIYPDQDREVVEMVIHEHFNPGSLYNDVALLFLQAPFDPAPNVNTICLPPAGINFDMSRCFATGWGKNQFQNGEYQNILKKIDLPVVENAKCQQDLRKTRLGKYFQLHSSFMCAGGEAGKDTCKGDGGSPLVCPMASDPNRYYQAGIVAWGIGCGGENIPGVYASVPKLRAWIDEQLAYKGIGAATFTP